MAPVRGVAFEPYVLLALQALGGLLSALVALRMRAAWKLTDAPSLGRFSFSFALLSLAQALALIQGIHLRATPYIRATAFDAFDVWFWGYHIALLAAWATLLTTFARPKFRWILAVAPVMLFAGPIAQLFSIFLTFLVVIHAGLNHIERAGPGSLQTAIGFFLLFAAQCAFLFGYVPLEPRNLTGEIAHVVGVAILYAAIRWPRGAPG